MFSGPLFNAGRTLGTYRASIAQWEQVRLQYEQAVLIALREVSDALTALAKLTEAEAGQDTAVRALADAVDHATDRYRHRGWPATTRCSRPSSSSQSRADHARADSSRPPPHLCSPPQGTGGRLEPERRPVDSPAARDGQMRPLPGRRGLENTARSGSTRTRCRNGGAEARRGGRRDRGRTRGGAGASLQSFLASRREKSARARPACNRTNGLHLAAPLLCPGVDAPRPTSNLEKENVHAFREWSCQAQ
jgi:hypothetical protein